MVQLYSCLDRITQVEWASNSLYVLCTQQARGILQVWSIDQVGHHTLLHCRYK